MPVAVVDLDHVTGIAVQEGLVDRAGGRGDQQRALGCRLRLTDHVQGRGVPRVPGVQPPLLPAGKRKLEVRRGRGRSRRRDQTAGHQSGDHGDIDQAFIETEYLSHHVSHRVLFTTGARRF
jgi:hypothetical protein